MAAKKVTLLQEHLLLDHVLLEGRRPLGECRVFAALMEHDGKRGSFPGKARLAKLTGLDPRSVVRSSRALKTAGYVRVIHRKKDLESDTNRYILNYAMVVIFPHSIGPSLR